MYYFSFIVRTLKQKPLIDGRTLMKKFDLKPSPLIGNILNRITEARLEGLIGSADEAMNLAATYLDGLKNGQRASTES